MKTRERSAERAFRALSISLFLAFILILIASFMPRSRLWGVNHLAFYGAPVRFLALAVMVLSFFPRIARALSGAFAASVRALSALTLRGWILTCSAIVAVLVLLFLLRIDANLMGNGSFLTPLLSSSGTETAAPATVSASDILRHERLAPGTMLLYLFASRISLTLTQSGMAGGIVVLNLLLFGALVFLLIRRMPESQMKPSIAVLFLYLAVFSGALVLFAGYLSKYTPFLMVAALYVLFAFRYLRRNEGLADPLILLVIACFFHVFGFLLLPSGIYLLVHRSRGGAPDGHKRIVSSLIIATALAAIILPMSSRFAIYYLPIVGNAETDGIISLGHIADVMNLLLLALPALPLLLSVPAINRSLTKDAGRPEAGAAGKKAVSRESGLSSQGADADSKDAIAAWRIHAAAEMSFAVLLFIPWLLFLILLRPQVSVARDWDRYTLALLGFFPLMIVGLKTILRLVPRPDRQAESGVGTDLPAKPLMPNGLASVVSPAVVITLVMSLAWLGINRSPEMSTLRFENLLAFEKASAVQGYGQLAFYHSSRGNIVKAIAASEKACAIDPSPDNVYTESLLYLTAEDTLHAIDLLEQSIKDHPDAHRNRQMLVTLFNSMERYADLTRVCKEGIKQEPDEPQYYYFLGKSYLYRGNLREGVIALMKCKQMNPPQSVLDNVDFLLSHIKEKEQ